jgi:hypothetical protein
MLEAHPHPAHRVITKPTPQADTCVTAAVGQGAALDTCTIWRRLGHRWGLPKHMYMSRRFWITVWLLAGSLWASPAQAEAGKATPATAFNTYALLPFVDDAGGGLAVDLVAYLNQRLQGSYRLLLETIPRSRLMRLHLADTPGFDGVVLFLHPRFVDDAEQQRFLWTEALFVDANVLVFRGPTAPPVRQLNDLAGMRFGASLDARYGGIDELVSSQQITRVDSSSLSVSLRQLLAERVDFTQTNVSALRAMELQPAWARRFVTVPVPGEMPFTRHILVGKQNPDLAERLATIVKAMPTDPQWRTIAQRYALQLPGARAATRPKN